jgi:hypothetical protein
MFIKCLLNVINIYLLKWWIFILIVKYVYLSLSPKNRIYLVDQNKIYIRELKLLSFKLDYYIIVLRKNYPLNYSYSYCYLIYIIIPKEKIIINYKIFF